MRSYTSYSGESICETHESTFYPPCCARARNRSSLTSCRWNPII